MQIRRFEARVLGQVFNRDLVGAIVRENWGVSGVKNEQLLGALKDGLRQKRIVDITCSIKGKRGYVFIGKGYQSLVAQDFVVPVECRQGVRVEGKSDEVCMKVENVARWLFDSDDIKKL